MENAPVEDGHLLQIDQACKVTLLVFAAILEFLPDGVRIDGNAAIL